MNEMGEFLIDPPKMIELSEGEPWREKVVERLVSMGHLRYCDVCGKPYVPDHGKRCYCSFACRMEANRYRARMRARRMRR